MDVLIIGVVTGFAAAGLYALFLTMRGNMFISDVQSSRGAINGMKLLPLPIGILAFWLSEGIVIGIGVAVTLWFVPVRYKRSQELKVELDRLTAVAGFASSISQYVSGGESLNSAVFSAARGAADAIKPECQMLRADLERYSLPESITKFADRIDHPSAHTLGAHLIMADELPSRGLVDRLRETARLTDQTVKASRHFRRERAKKELEIYLISILFAVIILATLVASPGFLDTFTDGWRGEAKLGGVVGLAFSAWLLSNYLNANVRPYSFALRSKRQQLTTGDPASEFDESEFAHLIVTEPKANGTGPVPGGSTDVAGVQSPLAGRV